MKVMEVDREKFTGNFRLAVAVTAGAARNYRLSVEFDWNLESSMLPEHHPLRAEEVLAKGGWHPRYARVIAVTSDGDYGFALIDGNGDGQELEAEAWTWREGTWMANGSSGAGPLGGVGPVRSGGQIDNAYFAYGSAPGQQVISISFDGRLYPTPVNRHGIWAFIKIRTDPHGHGLPTPA